MKKLLLILLLFVSITITAQSTFTFPYRRVYYFGVDNELIELKEKQYMNYKFTVSDDKKVITVHSSIEDVLDSYYVNSKETTNDGTVNVITYNNKGVKHMFSFPDNDNVLIFYNLDGTTYCYAFTKY